MREKKKGMSKAITRAAMHSMQQKLALRCEAKGVRFMKARPNFPSSQLCSRCGRPQKMPLGKKNDTYEPFAKLWSHGELLRVMG